MIAKLIRWSIANRFLVLLATADAHGLGGMGACCARRSMRCRTCRTCR
jgi:Cu/Ag efflux pump CusA